MDRKNQEIAETGSFIVSDVDTDEQNDEMVGHENSKGSRNHLKKAMNFEVDDLDNPHENLPTATNNTMFSENDYNTKFMSNEANFLTSTVTDDVDWQNIEKSELILMISALEIKVSSFEENIRNDLNELKEAVMKKREIRDVQEEAKITKKLGNEYGWDL